MPDFSPSAFEKRARERHPQTVTLVLTAHDRDAYLAGMMEAGVIGFLSKEAEAEQLVEAIRRAASGESLFDALQRERVRRWREEVARKWSSLTEREREILRLVGEGRDNKHIALHLCITTKAVEKHLTSIYEKLELASRAEAIIWWNERGEDLHT